MLAASNPDWLWCRYIGERYADTELQLKLINAQADWWATYGARICGILADKCLRLPYSSGDAESAALAVYSWGSSSDTDWPGSSLHSRALVGLRRGNPSRSDQQPTACPSIRTSTLRTL